MRYLLLCVALALSFPVVAEDKKAEKKTEHKKKAPAKKAAKKSEPKASTQDWGRFNSGGNKALDEQAKKDAAKKK